MTRENERKSISQQLAKKLLPVALAVAFMITLIIPAIYCYLEFARARSEASTYAKVLSGRMRNLAAESPALWKYQATKYSQIIHDFIAHKEIRSIVILDDAGNAITPPEEAAQADDSLIGFSIQGDPAPIIFNNRKIGEIKVLVSGRSIVLSGVVAFLACGFIGIPLALISYRVPLRVSSALEGRILEDQDTLEQKVEQRTSELQEVTARALLLSEQAQAAVRTKAEFLANMNHELRTPLNHVIGFTELLADRQCGDLNDQQEEYLRDVLHSGRHLLSMINEILDLATVEAGRLELEASEIYVGSLLERGLNMVKEKALKHRIRLVMEADGIPEKIRADERKLKQIIHNLLSNAVKFTPDGGSVTLSARYLSFKDGHWVNEEGKAVAFPGERDAPLMKGEGGLDISIRDTGIGIKKEDLERIFGSVPQGDPSPGRRFQGTGLGLSLTRSLVELHGGKIWGESEGEGKGSTFRFFIPLGHRPA